MTKRIAKKVMKQHWRVVFKQRYVEKAVRRAYARIKHLLTPEQRKHVTLKDPAIAALMPEIAEVWEAADKAYRTRWLDPARRKNIRYQKNGLPPGETKLPDCECGAPGHATYRW